MRDKQKIKKYKDLLLQENQKQNLISRKQENNIDNHIKDCLSISSHLSSNIMDLGTGGGLPGIPLAIEDPRKKVYLVEASQKKCSFLLHTKNLLGLENLHVINKRGEDLHLKDFAEDMDIVTRAFGTAEKTIKTTKKLLENPNNQLKLMKTEEALKEEKIPKGYEVKKIEDLDFALTPPEKSNLLGKCFFINLAQFNTCVSC